MWHTCPIQCFCRAGRTIQGRSSLLTQAINSGVASPSQPHAPASDSADRPTSPPSGLRTSTMRMPASTCRQSDYTHNAGSRCSPGSIDPAQRTTSAHFPRSSWDQSQSLPQNSALQVHYLEDLQASSTPTGRAPPFAAEPSMNTQASSANRERASRERASWDGDGQPNSLQPQLLTGHSDAVLSLCLDEHGRLYSSSSDTTIRVCC